MDNASSDDSVGCLQPLFPEVKWILNKQNRGFGCANNQALEKARGELVLFLNPDTLVPENCIATCIDFMEKNARAGALGVNMLDGGGNFLPESKRGYPGLMASFFKVTGLCGLFPKSPLFARYYLGHLPPGQNHPVEVLAGAFMLVRKKVLDTTGGFDERFFMYGEDIDLSYRINHAPIGPEGGYWKTWYLSNAGIIHFKGESTKKGTLNYLVLFYKAMAQFVQKHYGHGLKAGLFKFFIYAAIGIRALLSGLAGLAGALFKAIFAVVQSMRRKASAGKGKHYIDFALLPAWYVAGNARDLEQVSRMVGPNTGEMRLADGQILKPGSPLATKIGKGQGKANFVFCPSEKLSLDEITRAMRPLKNIGYAFHYPGSNSLVASNDKDKAGETYSLPCAGT